MNMFQRTIDDDQVEITTCAHTFGTHRVDVQADVFAVFHIGSVGVIASYCPPPFSERNHHATGGTTDVKHFALGGKHILQVPIQVFAAAYLVEKEGTLRFRIAEQT
ncbi:hypothetical protein D3C72_1758150 [compost metagenome]